MPGVWKRLGRWNLRGALCALDAAVADSRPMADVGGLKDARARRFRFFAVLTSICSIWFARDGGYAWHYFVQGSALLFDGAGGSAPAGGLDVYAHYPQFQIGPFSLAVAQGLRHLGPANGWYAAEGLMAGVGLVVLYALERITETVRPELVGDKRLNATLPSCAAARCARVRTDSRACAACEAAGPLPRRAGGERAPVAR